MIDQVSPAALSDWFAQHPGTPLVIDVREPHEVAMFSVKPEGVECVFMPMGTIPDRLAELDPKRPHRFGVCSRHAQPARGPVFAGSGL